MAKCDQGYLCELCGEPVKNLGESALYLRYVLGEKRLHDLFGSPERHLVCDRELAQYIVHEKFPPVSVSGEADKQELPEAERKAREELVTQGWVRLREVVHAGIPITEYPLPSV